MSKVLLAFVVAFFVMGNTAGCNTSQLPSVRQIELNIPTALLQCPNLPKSPGASATRRQTAIYITELYNTAVECKADNTQIRRLYNAYRQEINAALRDDGSK
jgi:hypothetical protein